MLPSEKRGPFSPHNSPPPPPLRQKTIPLFCASSNLFPSDGGLFFFFPKGWRTAEAVFFFFIPGRPPLPPPPKVRRSRWAGSLAESRYHRFLRHFLAAPVTKRRIGLAEDLPFRLPAGNFPSPSSGEGLPEDRLFGINCHTTSLFGTLLVFFFRLMMSISPFCLAPSRSGESTPCTTTQGASSESSFFHERAASPPPLCFSFLVFGFPRHASERRLSPSIDFFSPFFFFSRLTQRLA